MVALRHSRTTMYTISEIHKYVVSIFGNIKAEVTNENNSGGIR